MLNRLSNALSAFKHCFSRITSFQNFVVIIIGLMTCSPKQGITSIVDFFHLAPERYGALIKFFRSKSYKLSNIWETWCSVIRHLFENPDEHTGENTEENSKEHLEEKAEEDSEEHLEEEAEEDLEEHLDGNIVTLNNHNVLVGDGLKNPKEGLRMPGVGRIHQESEDVSKSEYTFGHLLGCIGIIAKGESQYFCIPTHMSIQSGLKPLASWSKECKEYEESHVIQTIRNAYKVAQKLGKSYCVLDRYFLSAPGLCVLDNCNKENHLLDLIVRAKSNCVAFEEPVEPPTTQRGRKRKKGEAVKLKDLFERTDFESATVTMYGKEEKVEYLSRDLLWGGGLYRKLRFVLVKSENHGNIILASTDLSLHPVLIIRGYSYRFKIEGTFKSLKQSVGAFLYHFWSKDMPKLSHYKKSSEPSDLSKIEDSNKRRRIMDTVDAMQRYVQFACIALGLSQMLALNPKCASLVERGVYKRTKTPGQTSEGSVLVFLRRNIFWLMMRNPKNLISQFILKHQNEEDLDELADLENSELA